MSADTVYDIVIIGNYTKDTVISPSGTRLVDGGGFNYGAHVAAMMGLKTAAVTRLAAEDVRVVEALRGLSVSVFPTYTPHSTLLQLYYPTTNVDDRVISVTQTAGVFTPGEVRTLEARAFLINASTRGEVGMDVISELRRKQTLLAADVQGFVRVISGDGTLKYDPWPEKRQFLPLFDILKTDAVEAEALTGESDREAAARAIAACGVREVVLTHRDGLLVLADGQLSEAPFRPRELVGRSGRGDTCIASYVCKRLTAPPGESCVWAAAVTSLKMEAEGPIKRTVSEVEALVRSGYHG
jgi:sugar/nucleoside kinase (ribokinase family)